MEVNPPSLQPETVFEVLERKRMLDASWIVCWVSLLAVLAVPWFLNVLAIDLGKAAWFVFASAVVYVVVGALTNRLTNQVALLPPIPILPPSPMVPMRPLCPL